MDKEQIIEAMAKAICDEWGYLWEGSEEDEQVAPKLDTPYDERPSKQLYRKAAAKAYEAIEPEILILTLGEIKALLFWHEGKAEASYLASEEANEIYHEKMIAKYRTLRDRKVK